MSKQSLFFIIGMMIINIYCFGQTDSSSNMIKKKELPYTYVEQMPSYKGGDKALDSIIKKNIKYPKAALKERIGGEVKMKILVDSSGKVKDVKISEGVRDDLDKEAMRLAYLLNDWRPGKINGRIVESYTDFKIYFYTEDKRKKVDLINIKPNTKK